MKKVLVAAAACVLASTGANAGVLVSELGTTSSYNFPASANASNSIFFTFDGASAAAAFQGFTRTGGTLLTGDSAAGAEPETFGNVGSQYLSTIGGATSQISQTARGFDTVSFFLGSIDTYNTINILSTTGAIIATFVGSQLTAPAPANGNQQITQTNRRITFTRQGGDAQIGGIRFSSGQNSLEVENLVFTVPEPSTWAFMLAGFGLIGFSMRARRRRTSVVYA